MAERYPAVHNWLKLRTGGIPYNPSMGGIQVAVREGGETVLDHAYGYAADREKGVPMDTADRLSCGSITKAVTVIEALRAVEAGTLSLTTTLGELIDIAHLAEPRVRALTLEQLLSHTSGLPFNLLIPGVFMGDGAAGEPVSDEKFVENLARLPQLMNEPGEDLTYSNVGIVAAGMMVEAATGKSIDELVRENIFGPLGMENSGFDRGQRHVEVYSSIARAAFSLVSPDDAFHRSSGMLSTAGDLARLGGVLQGERPDVLSDKMLAYMKQPALSGAREGRGVFRDEAGWRSMGCTVIVLQN
jgi:CubicO group peptidase (beta-lactamase class C family)